MTLVIIKLFEESGNINIALISVVFKRSLSRKVINNSRVVVHFGLFVVVLIQVDTYATCNIFQQYGNDIYSEDRMAVLSLTVIMISHGIGFHVTTVTFDSKGHGIGVVIVRDLLRSNYSLSFFPE